MVGWSEVESGLIKEMLCGVRHGLGEVFTRAGCMLVWCARADSTEWPYKG
jgi:hypothetical protein